MSKGYCQIKGRGLKFCQGSIAELQQKLATLKKEQIIAWGAYWLAHYGLVGNCTIKGEDVNFTFEDTVNWFETLTEDEIRQIQAAYDSTQEFAKDLPKQPAKKKIVRKK